MKNKYFFIVLCFMFYACVKLDLPRDNPRDGKTVPFISTGVITNIATSSATAAGTVTSDGGSTITERGIIYSTTPSLSINNGSVAKATTAGSGSFTVSITGLLPNTRYYYTAYATNVVGTSYGTAQNFITLASGAAIVTSTPTQITANSAVSGGTINSDGGAAITAKGVCWSLSPSPTVNLNTQTNNGSGIASFSSTMSNLSPNKTYFVRAYATNIAGTNYGNEISFTTLANLPTFSQLITTSNVTSNSLSVSSQITDEGGGAGAVTQRGVCWSTNTNPTITDSKTADGSGGGIFVSSVTGLLQGTLYYLRAYATNSAGTSYSVQTSFTTRSSLPTVTTNDPIKDITKSTATAGGNVTSNGGSAITSRGVCWDTKTKPTISNSRTSETPGTGAFTSSITGLMQSTTYYVRAYATNSQGTEYGNEVSFQTTLTSKPTVTTGASIPVSAFSATISGNVTDNGGIALTERGIEWGTSQNAISNNKSADLSTTTGSFTRTITNLLPGTTYSTRAYATNALGTGYGTIISFTTPTTLPVVGSTAAITSITNNSAVSGGNITSNGGATLSARGVCWGIVKEPTVSLTTKTFNGTEIGAFTSNLSGLSPNTTYFVRAYATNSNGTTYGPEISFKTAQ
jgi:hypothetical protein